MLFRSQKVKDSLQLPNSSAKHLITIITNNELIALLLLGSGKDHQ